MLPEQSTPHEDLARAVGNLLHADPKRVSQLIDRLRGPGRSIESTVQGMSMRGCLAPGSRIRIELEPGGRHNCGDVVAFLNGEQLIVHRVVYCGQAGPAAGLILTRGDAPIVPDQPVSATQVLGRVTRVFQDGCWVEPGAIAPGSLRARMVSATIIWTATVLLHLSPGLTAVLLARLHRWEGVVRQARSQRQLRRTPAPWRTH